MRNHASVGALQASLMIDDHKWQPWDRVNLPKSCDMCGYTGIVHDEYIDGTDASYVCTECDAITPKKEPGPNMSTEQNVGPR